MIFTRWGTPIRIIGDCGIQRPKGFVAPVTLCQVQLKDLEQDYQFAEFLRATNGINEIAEAVALAPLKELSPEELAIALHKAS
jgi:hypothetical protein